MANRINYERVMEETIAALERDGQRPQLLLHACCAPCSSATLERLADHFDVTILYYNPNIAPPEEYHRREAELERFVRDAGYAARGITVVELPYDPQEFYTVVKGLENEPERGERRVAAWASISPSSFRASILPPEPRRHSRSLNAFESPERTKEPERRKGTGCQEWALMTLGVLWSPVTTSTPGTNWRFSCAISTPASGRAGCHCARTT